MIHTFFVVDLGFLDRGLRYQLSVRMVPTTPFLKKGNVAAALDDGGYFYGTRFLSFLHQTTTSIAAAETQYAFLGVRGVRFVHLN